MFFLLKKKKEETFTTLYRVHSVYSIITQLLENSYNKIHNSWKSKKCEKEAQIQKKKLFFCLFLQTKHSFCLFLLLILRWNSKFLLFKNKIFMLSLSGLHSVYNVEWPKRRKKTDHRILSCMIKMLLLAFHSFNVSCAEPTINHDQKAICQVNDAFTH